MAYFEIASERLEKWTDYFLSFTDFNPSAPQGINVVNLRHRALIGQGGGLLVKRPAAVDQNLLARALDNWFDVAKNLRGFFWEKQKDPGQVVIERLPAKARESFVFIQILQSALFRRDPNAHTNYCLLEYEAVNTDPSRVLVLLAEPRENLIKAEDIEFEDFESWYHGLIGRTLEPIKPVGAQTATVELDRIADIVKKQVKDARQKLVSGVPN